MLKLKIAIFSDVHSNWEAWQAVKADIVAEEVDQIICLGDTVGYGPNPQECFTDVHNFATIMLKGNHEASVLDRSIENGLNWMARKGVVYSRDNLDAESIDQMYHLPHQMQSIYDMVFCHGALTENHKYIVCPEDTQDEFQAMKDLKELPARFCFVGHTHVPFVFGEKNGLYPTLLPDMKLDDEQMSIINVGSVGQPRDGDCRASYGIFSFELVERNEQVKSVIKKATFNLKRVFYNIQETANKMEKAELPARLSERLFVGQ